MEMKDFFSMTHLPHIFNQVSKGVEDSGMLYAYQDPLRGYKHGNDGIIFTSIGDVYGCGTCRNLLKWKPADMNSVDFQVRTVWRNETGSPGPQPRFQIFIAQSGMLQSEPYDWITFSPKMQERFENDALADRRVIECVYDPEWETLTYPDDDDVTWDNPVPRRGGWKYERMREDKTLPNDVKTVKSVEQSAKDGVTQEELLSRLQQHYNSLRR